MQRNYKGHIDYFLGGPNSDIINDNLNNAVLTSSQPQHIYAHIEKILRLSHNTNFLYDTGGLSTQNETLRDHSVTHQSSGSSTLDNKQPATKYIHNTSKPIDFFRDCFLKYEKMKQSPELYHDRDVEKVKQSCNEHQANKFLREQHKFIEQYADGTEHVMPFKTREVAYHIAYSERRPDFAITEIQDRLRERSKRSTSRTSTWWNRMKSYFTSR